MLHSAALDGSTVQLAGGFQGDRLNDLVLRRAAPHTALRPNDLLPTPASQRIRRWLPGVAALLFAALLIFPGFAHLSIWLDEGWTIHAAQQPDVSGVMAFVQQDSFPPLDFYVLHGWQALLGPNLINLRIPGVWAMLLAVALTYRLALDCFGVRAATAAALLLAASDIVLAFVPFARPYNLYLMLAVLSSWTYWRFTRRYAASWGAGYVVSALLLIYTIYWGGFILIAHGLHALIYRRAALKRLIPVAAAVTLGFLPWLPQMIAQATGGSLGIGDSGGFLYAEPLNRDGLAIIAFQLFGVPEVLFAGLAAAGLVGTFAARRWREVLPTEATALMGVWLVLPIALPVLFSLAGYNLLTYRPMIGLVPALVILIGHVLGQMRAWTYTLIAGLLVAVCLTTTGSTHPFHGPWWAVADTLRAEMAPQDALYIESDLHAYAIEEHARLADVPHSAVIRGLQIREDWAGETDQTVAERLAQVNSLWLVTYLNETYDPRPDLSALGFAQTTPDLDFGPFINHPITVARYARQPDPMLPWTFADSMQLAQADTIRDGETLHVDLTWFAAAQPTLDYTVAVYLMAPDGFVHAQHDSYPLDGRAPTSGWQAGHLVFDRHTLDISAAPPGEYRIAVRVYTWWDGAVQPVTPCETETCQDPIVVGAITLD